VPLRAGVSMRPLHFEADGYALQLKVDPGTTITRHRHSGEVHALNISGYREIINTGEIVGPGDYVYEPPGNVDTWRCYGAEPCIIHIALKGRIDYLDDEDRAVSHSDRNTALAHYLEFCRAQRMEPDPRIVGANPVARDPATNRGL
jgi:2,4'-dihydroxyacetophenone dioxygenase